MFACISSSSPTPQLAPSPPNKWSFWHNRNSFPCGLGSLFIRGVATITEPVWPGSILTPSPARLFGRWKFFCPSWKFWRKTELQLWNIILMCLKTTQQLPLNCDDFAELYRGHFSCRQLYLQLAQLQISQDFCIFAKTRIAGFAKTFCQRMLAPANVQKFIDTIWNLSQSHGSLFFFVIFSNVI